MNPQSLQGMLLVDKPKDWTSFDAVNYVRRMVATIENKKPKNCKVGHTGTLDPLATGLLILLIGKDYTRRAGEFSKADKTYDVTMKLGETSTTADGEGDKTIISAAEPSLQQVESALQTYCGDIMQTPPIYSAMKVGGVRAYKLAREGKEVKMEARPTTIYSNRLTSYEYPYVTFTSRVSSGTYIRSLVEDVGKELGTGAWMSDLRRTSIGDFVVQNGVEPASLTVDTLAHILTK